MTLGVSARRVCPDQTVKGGASTTIAPVKAKSKAKAKSSGRTQFPGASLVARR